MAGDFFDASEAEIARRVVAELQRQGFTTHEEVEALGKRADVVGLRGPLTVVVETKTNISLRLLDQLCQWRGSAHWIIGAVGKGRRGVAVQRLCQAEGFGLWEVAKLEDWINESIPPALHRRADVTWLRKYCVAENATGSDYAKAGTQGGYYTPFRRTARELADVVKRSPGITLRDALAALANGHHYSSDKTARSSMPACIDRGIVPGVRVERDGRALKLYPA